MMARSVDISKVPGRTCCGCISGRTWDVGDAGDLR